MSVAILSPTTYAWKRNPNGVYGGEYRLLWKLFHTCTNITSVVELCDAPTPGFVLTMTDSSEHVVIPDGTVFIVANNLYSRQ